MPFGIFKHTSDMPKSWQTYMIMYGSFMVIVKPCIAKLLYIITSSIFLIKCKHRCWRKLVRETFHLWGKFSFIYNCFYDVDGTWAKVLQKAIFLVWILQTWLFKSFKFGNESRMSDKKLVILGFNLQNKK